MARLAKQVQAGLPETSTLKFEIKILVGDLKTEGSTQNQPVRDLEQSDQPLPDEFLAKKKTP